MSEERYAELIEEVNEPFVVCVLAAKEEYAAVKESHYTTVGEHMAALDVLPEGGAEPI